MGGERSFFEGVIKLRVSRDKERLLDCCCSEVEAVVHRTMRATREFQSQRNQRLSRLHLERHSQQGFDCSACLFYRYLVFPKALPEDVPELRKNKVGSV